MAPNLINTGGLQAPNYSKTLCSLIRPGPVVVQLPGQSQPGIDPSASSIIEDYQYSNGLNMEIPGQGIKKVMNSPQGITWPAGTIKATSDYWALKCTQATQNADGFIATAPNGDVYTFANYIVKGAAPLPVGTTALHRLYIILQATEVKDVNGNWVRYTYDSAGKVTRIHSNDGREITFSYGAGNRLNSATANGRTWSYNYTTFSGGYSLSSVTLPDSRQWSFNLQALVVGANPDDGCAVADQSVSLTHPNGAIGTFVLRETRHLKGYTGFFASDTFNCIQQTAGVLPFFDAMSVKSKTLTGSGYPSSVWNYTYSGYTSGTPASTKWGQVVDPLGRTTKSTYHRATDLEGLIQKTDAYANGGTGSPIRTTNFTYTIENALGTSWLQNENTGKFIKPRNQFTHVLNSDGDTFSAELTYNTNQSSSLYSFSRPTKAKRWSNVSTTQRVTDLTYVNRTAVWVLALPNVVIINGRTTAQFGYDALGRKIWQDVYGNRVADFSYNTGVNEAGTIRTITNALGNTYQYLNFQGGQPTQFVRPDGISEYQSIDNNGWVTSSTDAMGYVTSYNRDNMGRVTKVIPSKTQAAWLDTDIAYSFGTNTIQTITKGNARTTITYDGFTRPVLEKTTDLSTGVSTYVNTSFNALGETVFSSQPSASPTTSAGINTTYDGLGRITATAETVAPFATTSTAYLSSHRTRITDASGAQTTNYNNGFGELIRILQPLGVNTYLNRNIWGQQVSLRQVGTQNGIAMDQTNTYVYDSLQRLCRHHTNEGGSSLYQYDVAGQMVAYSKGNAAGSTCVTPSGNNRVDLFYDNLGRNWATLFTDPNTPDISKAFNANGNVTIVSRDIIGEDDNVDWFYFYNELNMLTAEILLLDSKNFSSGYAYNTAGQMTARTYPGGNSLVTTMDGLGRATKLQSGTQVLADNIAYHPSGAMSAMTYGNGQVFSQTLNARLQPLNTRTAKPNGAVALDYTYAYDARGKVTSVVDNVLAANNRVYGYDALGRVTTASGPWGAGSFTYDALGNLRTKILGGRLVTNTYNNATNMVTLTADSAKGNRTITHDARGNITKLGAQNFAYDTSDQPTILSSASGAAVGTYLYDGNMKRVKSDINGKVIYNVYDASGTLIHVDDLGTSKKTDYIGKIARITNGNVTYLHKDHLGSASAGTSSTGAVAWNEQYTPFGETILNPAANDNLDGYTGHIKDKATGLNYMQARYYDPALGRFLSIDPVGFMPSRPGQFNRYSYTYNDPINLTDPTGMCPGVCGYVRSGQASRDAIAAGEALVEGALTAVAGIEVVLIAGDIVAAGPTGEGIVPAAILRTGRKAVERRILKAAKPCCFVAGTLVQTKDGLRPIEELQVGDLVLARDTDTGETKLKPITDLIRRHDRVIWEVALSGANGETELFETTDDHPWWIAGIGWKTTEELTANMSVVTADGRGMVITSITKTSLTDATYNITVADFETYFVGKQQVLVHNCKKKLTKKERKAETMARRKAARENEPMSEAQVQNETKGMTPKQKREVHDAKRSGEPDRSKKQFEEDVKDTGGS
jgi:RHS repeat-associated protein